MAMLPCDYGRHRFPEKIGHLYPALLDGRGTRRRPIRTCPRHAAIVLEHLRGRRVDYDTDFPEVDHAFTTCITCGHEVTGEASSFFLTAYLPGQERVDYAGTLHRACEPPEWSLLPANER